VNECKHWLLMEWFQYYLCIRMVWTWRPLMKKSTFVKNVFRKYEYVLEVTMCVYAHIHTTNCTDVSWLYTMCGNPPTCFAVFWPSSGRYSTKRTALMASCNWYMQILQLNCRILKLNQKLKYLYMQELPF